MTIKSKKEFIEWAEKIAGPFATGSNDESDERWKITFNAIYKGLQRFIDAQDRGNTYQKALEEIQNGKKETHWIWFIFPQLSGLGKSETAYFYGINGREEAEVYINHPVLRERLIEVTEAVYNSEKSVYEIFGNDAIKVRSCMLLFASVSDEPIFKKMIAKYGWN